MKKLFLLDGHALVYRAHYAFMTRPLLNSKGWNVSCISGFTRTLLDVLKREKPTHLAVAFDLPTPTFRHTMYEPYKAQRDAQPEDISFGLPYIRQILKGMNIPIVTADGYEADDVIGTLAKQAETAGFEVFMMTPDKDFGQLVSDRVFLYKPARMGNEVEIWGVKEVLEKWDIERVEQVVDMLGLQGDAVDNIPGIPGIGPKSAAVLLKQFGTVENLIANADKLKGKQQENVRNFAEQGLLSKQLAAIELGVPVTFDEDAYRLQSPNPEILNEVFKDLEFRSIAREILGDDRPAAANDNGTTNTTAATVKTTKSKVSNVNATQTSLFDDMPTEALAAPVAKMDSAPPAHSVAHKNIDNTEHTYHLCDTAEKRAELIAQLQKTSIFAFDTETTGLDATQAQLVGLSFSWQAGEGFYVNCPADQAQTQAIVDEFRPIFENPDLKKVGQNLKYDLLILRNYGLKVRGVAFDTMIAHYLMEPELRHGMDYMARTYLQYEPVSIETLIGKGKNQLSMRDAPLAKVAQYAAEDADVTFQLYQLFAPQIEQEQLTSLFETVEMPLLEVLTDIEYEGIRIDADFLANYAKGLSEKITEIEIRVYEQAGKRFNISSPKQVGETLFDFMKLPYRWKKTGKTDQYSTDEEKLSELALNYPIAATVLEYRSLTKLLSTYVEALPRMINPRTGRVHTSFNQALTATGRLSSNNPNLQNIPIRTTEGREIRRAFVARDADHVLLSADYSQIELRLIAHMAPEAAMLEAFQSGTDIHLATAAKVYDTPLLEVSSDQRRNAKTVNFSIIYGAGAQNLSQQLGLSRSDSKKLIEAYFDQYKGLKAYMQRVVDEARQTEYVATILGRKRYLRDLNSRNQLARSNAERMAINSPIQGSAADLIKIAMINIQIALKEKGLQTKMILQVHDELLFDVPRSEVEIIKPLIVDLMKNAIGGLQVPIEVSAGVGENWLEAH